MRAFLDLPPMRFLVTGAAGFIGSHLVDALLASGHRVVGLDDFDAFYDPAIKRENIAVHRQNPRYRLAEGDIRDEALLERLFADATPDVVVHLAARAGVRPSLEDPAAYQSVNVAGTLHLLEQCRRSRVRKFVFGSSSSVYGLASKVPFNEENPVAQPISPYAATKASAELLCHTYSHLYGIQVVCLRFFTVYGERQRPDLAIHKFTRLIAEGRPVPLFGDGSTRRDYTYIGDILDGIQRAIAYDETPYEIINLGESRTVELRELVAILERVLERKAQIDWQPSQPGDVPLTYADVSKARHLLGYEPRTTIEEGIARFVRWYLGREATHAR